VPIADIGSSPVIGSVAKEVWGSGFFGLCKKGETKLIHQSVLG